ncbi:hypothetical protein [uncultured Thiodictyon sp.]|uniref:hypothetical protein n=1 Tax=uncultured Thiodictyon sp. TaxID=1846217 RepID=UPI0025F3F33B|nr:hypothetical protein [uncultured Thiodictyon sp.]
MNTKPLDEASDPDLRNSLQAMRRATKRAREIAAQTGTDIVVQEGSVIRHISPGAESKEVAEPQCR